MSDVTIMLKEYGVPFVEIANGSILVEGKYVVDCIRGIYYVDGQCVGFNPDVVVSMFHNEEGGN